MCLPAKETREATAMDFPLLVIKHTGRNAAEAGMTRQVFPAFCCLRFNLEQGNRPSYLNGGNRKVGSLAFRQGKST